jgi:beta-glucosidase
MKKKILTAVMATACVTTMNAQPKLSATNIDEVIAAMTLEEKAQLLVGGGNQDFAGSGAMLGHQEKLVAGAAGITVAIPRLGIPATVLTDGPAGVHIDAKRKGDPNSYAATGFPVGTCLACTWNTDLVRRVGEAIGNETLEYGCDVVLGPGLNLHRNPLCGRNFEYFSEDPVITGKMGAAVTKGIQSQGVGVSGKHYAVNSQESDRTRVDERVSQRALRELYLRGFEYVVRESDPWTLMSAYNQVNGSYAQGSHDLLTKVLRDDWGFQGIVMTDWIGKREGQGLYTIDQVVAGNDLFTPGYSNQVADIVKGVKEGKLDMKYVDLNVRRMLEYIVKTPHFRGYKFSNKPDLKAHAAITRQSSTEGMVLLKNNGVLPIRNLKTVALFGVNSYDFLSGGLGSGAVNVPYRVDMVQGLKNIGVKTTPQLTEIYQTYVKYATAKLRADKNPMMWFLNTGQPKLDEIEITQRCVDHELREADAAIITIGRQAGEGIDRQVQGEFNLSADEKNMIERVSDSFRAAGKPVIVIINSGSVMETTSWRDRADAILCAWQPGMEGGNAVADVLTGKANPSGKLTMTWPIAATDHPSTKNFPQEMDAYTFREMIGWNSGISGRDYTNHEEDIYVGYRYFDTFKREVAYPFGFGLSYTTFAFSKPSAKVKDGTAVVSITVKNTGSVAGKEVAQVYVSAPKGSIEKPLQELKAFAKTRELKPGEQQTLTMTIPVRELSSFDEADSQWLVEPGTYTFRFGASSRDIRCTAAAKVPRYTEKVSNVLAPKVKLNLLKQ